MLATALVNPDVWLRRVVASIAAGYSDGWKKLEKTTKVRPFGCCGRRRVRNMWVADLFAVRVPKLTFPGFAEAVSFVVFSALIMCLLGALLSAGDRLAAVLMALA